MRRQCFAYLATTLTLASNPYDQVIGEPIVEASIDSAVTDSAKYAITDLGTLGGTENFAWAINARGDIVGLSRMQGDSSAHTFLYRHGTITDLYPLNSQNILTVGAGINNRGQVASGVISRGVYLPAIYDSRTGNITVLGSLGGVTWFGFNGVATSINNHGQAAGYSYLDSLNRHAFLYASGVMIDIGSLEDSYSLATDINDDGDIVGSSAEHAFLYRGGVMIEINPFGNPRNESYANSINNKGQVVGTGLNADDTAFNAFIYSDGWITNLGTLNGGRYSEALSINEKRQVVGVSDYLEMCFHPVTGEPFLCSTFRGFLYENGVMTDLNSLIPANAGWDLQFAYDINNRGQIVGYGLLNGRWRGYVMTPVSRGAKSR